MHNARIKAKIMKDSIVEIVHKIKPMKTPQAPSPTLTAALGSSAEVWLKREDKHHYGSHKGRSIPLMIAGYHKSGFNAFVISSSGNAGLAAIHAVQTHNKNKPSDPLTLQVFIGEKIDWQKEHALQDKIGTDTHITLIKTLNPKQSALQMDKENKAKILRQSTDETALLGYTELARELSKIDKLAAVFIPTSSGTTAQGLHLGFKQLGLAPQIHCVQTTACHPIAELVTTLPIPPKETSLAGAIVDAVAMRKDTVAEIIRYTHGGGWIATNKDIEQALELAKKTNDLDLSPNSALAIVGLQKAIQAGFTWTGPVVCLITGA